MNEWRWLLGRTRPYLGWMLAGIALSSVVILANVALLGLSGWFISAMAVAGLAGATLNYFTPAAAIRGLAITRTLGRYLERLITHESTFRLLAELRQWFFERLEPLAPARLQYLRGGDLLSRIRADIDTLENAYLRILVPAAAALFTTLVMAGFLAWFSPAIAVSTLLLLALSGIALPWISQCWSRQPGEAIVAARTELRNHSAETIRGLGELAIYGGKTRRLQRIATLNHELVTPQRQRNRVETGSSAIAGLLAQLAWLITLLIGIGLLQAGLIDGPILAMLVLFVMAAFEAVAPLPIAWQAWGETRAAARRLIEIVDTEPAVCDPATEAPPPSRFDIHFERACLTYPGSARPALDEIDLDIPQGSRIAITGPSGAGKTSLTQVLLRFWPLSSGTLRIGGTAIDQWNGDTVRGWCSVVGQHTHLFNASIADNLRLARPDADDAQLEQACRAARIHEQIAAMPDGYDTVAGEIGARLSGGQARRIAIARALLKDAPILILDEPTEGLDAESERAVVDAIAPLIEGRTVLMITHRPQLLRLAERVIEIREGRLSNSNG